MLCGTPSTKRNNAPDFAAQLTLGGFFFGTRRRMGALRSVIRDVNLMNKSAKDVLNRFDVAFDRILAMPVGDIEKKRLMKEWLRDGLAQVWQPQSPVQDDTAKPPNSRPRSFQRAIRGR
jgi:hypothetical protein